MSNVMMMATDLFSVSWGPAGDLMEGAVKGAFEFFGGQFFSGGHNMLKAAFEFGNQQGSFEVGFSGNSGLARIWPYTSWIGLIIVLGLLFWQVAMSLLQRNGATMATALLGVVKYVIITACFVGVIATFNGVMTALTSAILGLPSKGGTFGSAGSMLIAGTSGMGAQGPALAMILGFLMILLGVLVAILFSLMQIGVIVLLALSPIVAAGVVAESSATWWHRLVKWVAALLMAKPVIAIVLVVALMLNEGAKGPWQGLVTLMAVFAICMVPWLLIKMIDSATGGNMQMALGKAKQAGMSALGLGAGGAAAGAAGAGAGSQSASQSANMASNSISSATEQRQQNAEAALKLIDEQEQAQNQSSSADASNQSSAGPTPPASQSPSVEGGTGGNGSTGTPGTPGQDAPESESSPSSGKPVKVGTQNLRVAFSHGAGPAGFNSIDPPDPTRTITVPVAAPRE